MLKLHQFPGPWDVCSASPFCAKLEAYLRWQGIEYEPVSIVSLKGAPKGKIPFIELDGASIGDSRLIIEHLAQKAGVNPDDWLTPAQKAQGRAVRYLCEEGLYWVMVYFRWIEPQGWKTIRQGFFSGLPAWLRPAAGWTIRRYVRKQLRMQGTGRHTREEIAANACADLRALADWIGEGPYIFGERMTLADLTIFSMTANFITGPFDNPVSRCARTLPALENHAARVRERCFAGKTAPAA